MILKNRYNRAKQHKQKGFAFLVKNRQNSWNACQRPFSIENCITKKYTAPPQSFVGWLTTVSSAVQSLWRSASWQLPPPSSFSTADNVSMARSHPGSSDCNMVSPDSEMKKHACAVGSVIVSESACFCLESHSLLRSDEAASPCNKSCDDATSAIFPVNCSKANKISESQNTIQVQYNHH